MKKNILSVCICILFTVLAAGCAKTNYEYEGTDAYTEALTEETYRTESPEITGTDYEINSAESSETGTHENNTLEDFEDKPITMKEAYEIAYEEAVKWSDDVGLIRIGSTDNHDISSMQNGIDGKRNCWSVLFYSEKKGIQYHIYVICGRAMFGVEGNSPTPEYIDISKFEDSPYLYEAAVENGISAGYDFAWGFHYSLQYYVIDGDRDNPVLLYSVRGRDSEGREARLSIDALTGVVNSISVKTGYDQEGRSIWMDIAKPDEEQTENNDTAKDLDAEYYRNMSKEEFEEHFNLFELCVKYMRDPQELHDVLIKGMESDSFHPYLDAVEYDEDEWRKRMTDYYGEGWEERMSEVDVSDSPYWN